MLSRCHVQAGLAAFLFAVLVDPARAHNHLGPCGAGYLERQGDIPGWGSINGKGGGEAVDTCADCRSLCNGEPLCLSFECSITELKCNLNSAPLPSQAKYNDYKFCSKNPVDECSTTHDCDADAQCTDTAGSFTCSCNSGYTGSGVSCQDIDECTSGSDNCDANAATCTNTVGSYACACNAGYNGDGLTCQDIDECDNGDHNCDANTAACTNTAGSYACACNAGYNGDGVTCQDIDECTSGSDNCDANAAACTNTVGSYACACNAGFEGDGVTCQDIDECSFVADAGEDICDFRATCANTEGSFSCSCNAGYEGGTVSEPGCSDINECANGDHDCDANTAACTNTAGSYACACNAGFDGDGVTCQDIDECDEDICDANAACTNTVGAYTCACNAGFDGDGVTCQDIDECDEAADAGEDICKHRATCANTEGSFSCSCNAGYEGYVSALGCNDINECDNGDHDCDANAACQNRQGSFSCACNAGYNGDGVTCMDIDECTSGSDNCDANAAACTNTAGSYACACNVGYNGDGVTCQDIDECTSGSDNCDANAAACTNTAGSYSCACNAGYDGDGVTCEDITECGVSDNCDANAVCEDGGGSFSCTCNGGYASVDQGLTCTFTGVSCDDSVMLGLYETCTFPSNGCCDAAAGLTCYRKDKTYAQCLETGSCATSNPSWECTEFEGFDSICADQPEATLSEHADCTSNTAGCASCNEYGEPMACYQKDEYYSQCLVVDSCPPLDWGDGTHSCAATFNTDNTDTGNNPAGVRRVNKSPRRGLKATVLPDTDTKILQPFHVVITEQRSQPQPPIPSMVLGTSVFLVAVLGVAVLGVAVVVAHQQTQREKSSARFLSEEFKRTGEDSEV